MCDKSGWCAAGDCDRGRLRRAAVSQVDVRQGRSSLRQGRGQLAAVLDLEGKLRKKLRGGGGGGGGGGGVPPF